MRARGKKSPEWLARGGQSSNAAGRLSAVPIIGFNRPPVKQVAQLAQLRQAYNAAILTRRWAEAERLQRAYHDAEQERRRELLRQARERGRQ